MLYNIVMKKILICLTILLLITGCHKNDNNDPVDNGLSLAKLWEKLTLEENHAWQDDDTNFVFSKQSITYYVNTIDESRSVQKTPGKVIDMLYQGNNVYTIKVTWADETAVDPSFVGGTYDYKVDISNLPGTLVIYTDSATYMLKDRELHIVPENPDDGYNYMSKDQFLLMLAEVESWTNSNNEFFSIVKREETYYYMEGIWNSGGGSEYNEITSFKTEDGKYLLGMYWNVYNEDSETPVKNPVTITFTYDPEKPDEVYVLPFTLNPATFNKDYTSALSSDQLWEYLDGQWESYTSIVPYRFYTLNGNHYVEIAGPSADLEYILTEYRTSHFIYDMTFVREDADTELYLTINFDPDNPNQFTIEQDYYFKGE